MCHTDIVSLLVLQSAHLPYAHMHFGGMGYVEICCVLTKICQPDQSSVQIDTI